jgi:hypothetical protein
MAVAECLNLLVSCGRFSINATLNFRRGIQIRTADE